MSSVHYDWRAVVARLLFSLFLVFALYNPSGYSYWHWLWGGDAPLPLRLFVGLILLGLHALVWRAAYAVLRPAGVAYLLLLCILSCIGLHQAGLLDAGDAETLLVCIVASAAVVLTGGLVKPALMHRLTGVQHVEEVPH